VPKLIAEDARRSGPGLIDRGKQNSDRREQGVEDRRQGYIKLDQTRIRKCWRNAPEPIAPRSPTWSTLRHSCCFFK